MKVRYQRKKENDGHRTFSNDLRSPLKKYVQDCIGCIKSIAIIGSKVNQFYTK